MVNSGTCTAQWDVTSKQDNSKGDPTYLQTLQNECMGWFAGALHSNHPNPSECAKEAIVGGVAGYDDDFKRNDDPIVAIYPIGTPGQCFATEHPDGPDTAFGYKTNCDTNGSTLTRWGHSVTSLSLHPREESFDCKAVFYLKGVTYATCAAALAIT